ncbi:MAG TPA: GNAT family N-acetyltransferase, partial [Acidimicrobiales bacterium]|nr:GNAT family N-acetyltransferase [Acidimicrobiales bacterium]
VAVYEGRGLRPRLEYAPSAAPGLALALLAAGFTIEATFPLLTCEPGQNHSVAADGVSVSDAVDERDHQDAMSVAAAAYGGAPERPVPASWLGARMAMVASGGGVAVARDRETGEAVGSGLYQVPVEGVTELAAVGTLPTQRQGGVATAVISHLVGRALRQEVHLVWLTAEHDAERHPAEQAGFRDTGEVMVHISRSS